MEPFDYLAIEPLLIDRIRNTTQGFAVVESIDDLASVSVGQQVTPAAYVIYMGDDVGPGQGNAQVIMQLWAVVITVYYANSAGNSAGARRVAGPLISQVLTHLVNWKPRHDIAPLRRIPTQIPAEYADGYGYFPLIFGASFVYPPRR